jgi:hypothetical protein
VSVGTDVSGAARSRELVRAELIARVRARRTELVDAIFARVRDGAYSSVGDDDSEYVAGLRAAVQAAVEHGLAGIETGGQEGAEAIPAAALAQARRAAHAGVSLDMVLRRYVLGSTLMGDFLMQEAEDSDLAGRGLVLRDVLKAQAATLDRLMAAITGEYTRELERAARSPERRRAERVQRLLAGAPGEQAELGYELEGWHLGLIATGADPAGSLRHVAGALGNRLLCVWRGEDTVWGWLGGQRPSLAREVERAFECDAAAEVSLAIGEPGRGLEGWRLTHRQAQAALRVALHSSRGLTRYADVALLASVLHDDALAGSLVEIYLAPLGGLDNGGGVLRETLRAYFAAERNASSAASALGVTRHTVQNRLRTIEEKLGQSLRTRQAELEVALRLEELARS